MSKDLTRPMASDSPFEMASEINLELREDIYKLQYQLEKTNKKLEILKETVSEMIVRNALKKIEELDKE